VSVPAGRRGRVQVLLGGGRGCCWPGSAAIRRRWPRRRGRLQARGRGPGRGAARPGRGPARAGADQPGHRRVRDGRFEEAEPHLEQGVALARRIGRPYLEFLGLAHQAALHVGWSFCPGGRKRSRQAVELAERHGWTDEPAAGMAFVILGGALTGQGRLEEAEPWVQRAERTVRADAEPAVAVTVHSVRGLLDLSRGRDADALAAFRAVERLAGFSPHALPPPAGAGTAAAGAGAARRDRPRRAGPRRPRRRGFATAGRSASPRRCCGSPKAIRAG